ncbi:DsbA family protein [Pantoea septica]|uniref:DsbA family protein n=1 Tax=Pantoea septica TaxID=472695 RepID=UPI003D02FCE5
MNSQQTLTLTTFTDPMMGLSYESEPFFRKLETHFPGKITYRYVMSGLVRNVYDFVDQEDLTVSKEYALEKYRLKLAEIYKSEEDITGMPINMTDLQLFTTEYTSSIPLNLAYKAVQLADSSKADHFLYNIRFATIVECRPTTRLEEILAVVKDSGVSADKFLKHYQDGSALAAMNDDFMLRQSLGVRGLPAYLFEYNGKRALVNGVIGYEQFRTMIKKLSGGELTEKQPEISTESIRQLISQHPLISPVEIKEAFNLDSEQEVLERIRPFLLTKEILIKQVHRGWFIQKQ